jgi:Asp-tRNA(Asn)/Glu-tRNA(Gln) amidotransferase A subunit family amidase
MAHDPLRHPPSPAGTLPDLTATLAVLREGRTRAALEVERALEAAAAPACHLAFLGLDPAGARAAAAAADAARDAGRPLPLDGLPVSVKDLFDLVGQPTPAGSRVLQHAAPARRDARAVQRLRAAGASVVGRTVMTEFAFSGVGVNPHHGTPANPAVARLLGNEPHPEPHIPGGSSSGAAVSVAAGAAFIGLGSDTGGSIRIPAALCGLVGFKNTARLVPTEGALPLSTTLDTVCAITRSVRDAVLAHEVLAQRRVLRAGAPLASYRLAVPATGMLDELEPAVARAFDQALERLRRAGARIEHIALPEIADLSGIQAAGGFAAAESFAWHQQLLAERGDEYDPRVRTRIERGAAMKAYEYVQLHTARQAWIARIGLALAGFDALLSPTTPLLAPTLASLGPADGRDPAADAARDAEFFRVNALLLRNPSVVNMLDGCALSLPCHAPGDMPVGLMVWHGPMRDDTVLNVGLQVEAALAQAHAG